jgi:hypothetical protein
MPVASDADDSRALPVAPASAPQTGAMKFPLTNVNHGAKLRKMGKITAVGGTCVVMARTSTKGQKDAFTIKGQITKCKELVAEYGLTPLPYRPKGAPREMSNGVAVPEGWLIDDGRTGRLLGGRIFETFINDVRAGVVRPDYLVVADSDRTFRADTYSDDPALQERSSIDEAIVNSVLSGHHVKVIDKDGVHEDLRQKSVQNASELAKIRDRTIGGKAVKFAEGKRATGGRAPYGLALVREDPDNRKSGLQMVHHPVHAKILKEKLIPWFIAGGYTSAAKKATDEGILTPMSKTKDRKNRAADWSPTRWDPVSVQHIMNRARVYYEGEQTITFGGQRHLLKFEPLIDAKTYAAIIRAQQEQTLARRAEFLSTGFVDCGGTHKPAPKREDVQRERSQSAVHVHCKNSHGKHHVSCPEGCGRMPEAPFAAALWTATVKRLIEIAKHERGVSGSKDHFAEQVKSATARVREIEDRMGRLFDSYDSGELPVSAYTQRNAPLKDEQARAVAELARATGERDAQLRKKTGEQSLAARVGVILEELELKAPTLERRREVLSELLDGDRVMVTWPQGTGVAEITLPEVRGLPALVVRTDQIPLLVTDELQHVYMGLTIAGLTATASRHVRENGLKSHRAAQTKPRGKPLPRGEVSWSK